MPTMTTMELTPMMGPTLNINNDKANTNEANNANANNDRSNTNEPTSSLASHCSQGGL